MSSGGNSPFCVLPWVELHLNPIEEGKTCCAQFGQRRAAAPKPLLDQFNSEALKGVRRDFMNGRVPKDCSTCVQQSAAAATYMTVKNPEWLAHKQSRLSITSADGTVDGAPLFLDLRFGTLCNFSCRTCNSESSSKWYPLDRELGRNAVPLSRLDTDRSFMESVKAALPHAQAIYFAGGEPMILDGHFEVLEELARLGRYDVALTYNTNLSITRFKGRDVREYWKGFTNVRLYPSIDGIGEAGEYIRQGMSWEETRTNIEFFRPYIAALNSVVSVYNVHSILEHVLYFQENYGLNSHLFNAYSPEIISTTILPADEKERALRAYSGFLSRWESVLTPLQADEIRGVMKYLTSADHSRLGPEFRKFNDYLDRKHGRDFSVTFPELAGWYSRLRSA